MPAFNHHFMPLYPALEGDSYLGLQSKGLIKYTTSTGNELQVRFFCLDEQVRVIAVTIPEEATNHIDQASWMKQIMDNAISAIRLCGDPEASPLVTEGGFVNLMYQSDDASPRYEFPIAFRQNPDYRLNIDNVCGSFVAFCNQTLAPIVALFAEGQVPTVPPHYRVLSLIRAIELLYPNNHDREKALNLFKKNFAKLQISQQSFRKALPQLRTRCAHGRSRGRNTTHARGQRQSF